MEKRIRSPNCPSLSLPDAIDKVAALYRSQHTHAAPREVVARGTGYNSLNGASASAISALHKYGLLDRVGDEIRVSERALRILHPHSPEERIAAIREAAGDPPLFAQLNERFPGQMPSEGLLRNYLIRNGFAPAAVTSVITAYRETSEMAEREEHAHNSPRDQTGEDDKMATPHKREAVTGHQTTFTPISGEPFEIVYTPGGKIRISGELTSPERADEFIRAIEALKLLMRPAGETPRPPQEAPIISDSPPTSEDVMPARVSLMITQEQKAALRERGFSDEEIREMKPSDAHRILGLLEPDPAPAGVQTQVYPNPRRPQ